MTAVDVRMQHPAVRSRRAAGGGEGREGAAAEVGRQFGHLVAVDRRGHHPQDDEIVR